MNLSGIFYSKNHQSFEKKHIDPLIIDGTPVFNYCIFAETSKSRVFVMQQFDNKIYYTDNSISKVPLPVDKEKDKIFIYPNPVKDHLSIIFDTFQKQTTVAIQSIDGSILLEESFNNFQNIEISTERITPGSYILIVNQQNGKKYFRIIIQ